jgi:hypothetical protein
MEKLLIASAHSSQAEGAGDGVGILCDDQQTLAITAGTVEVIQAPFGPNRQDLLIDLKRAADCGAIVIVREILSGDRHRGARRRKMRCRSVLPSCGKCCLRTTDARHLDGTISAVGST